MKDDHLRATLDASFLTYAHHTESRIAARLGQGFYTIGSGGEELMSIVGLFLRDTDPVALHYRHVGTNLMRSIQKGMPLEQIALDRARAFTCSIHDPVTGGVHCAIGGHNLHSSIVHANH